MADSKLSQINGGTPVVYAPATDTPVGVRSGTTDYLFTGIAAGPGTSIAHHLASFANTDGLTLEDSGIPLASVIQAGGVQSSNTVRSTTQLDKTSDTTLANVVGLVQTVVAGTYQYKINLDTVSTVNGGVKAAFKYTTTVASTLNSIAKAFAAAAVAVARFTSAADQGSILASTTATVACEMVGTIIVTTGGTLQLQFAQNVSHADTSSVLVGSSMTFTRTA